MKNLVIFAALGAAFLTASALIGCSEQQATPTESQDAAPMPDATAADSEVEKEFAKLSPEDRELAMAQKICPVSGEPLGSMGPPLKVTVDGKSLFICCEGCREDAEKNFADHIAKLESAGTK